MKLAKYIKQFLDPTFTTHIIVGSKQMHITYIGKNGKICPAGRYAYQHDNPTKENKSLIKELVKQANLYMQGKRKTIPSAHYVDGIFQII